MTWQLLAIIIRLGVGLLLFYATLRLLEALLLSPAFQQLLVTFGILLAGAWALYRKLPDWMQEVLRSLWTGKEGKDD